MATKSSKNESKVTKNSKKEQKELIEYDVEYRNAMAKEKL